jgi:hypothetical protein
VPGLFRAVPWRRGARNADLGGGPYDLATSYLARRGVESVVVDPGWQTEEELRAALARVAPRRADTVTVANTLNVVRDPDERARVLQLAAHVLAPDGVAYVAVYEGDGSSRGRVTTRGWQANRPLRSYLSEVRRWFGRAETVGRVIVATGPVRVDAPPLTCSMRTAANGPARDEALLFDWPEEDESGAGCGGGEVDDGGEYPLTGASRFDPLPLDLPAGFTCYHPMDEAQYAEHLAADPAEGFDPRDVTMGGYEHARRRMEVAAGVRIPRVPQCAQADAGASSCEPARYRRPGDPAPAWPLPPTSRGALPDRDDGGRGVWESGRNCRPGAADGLDLAPARAAGARPTTSSTSTTSPTSRWTIPYSSSTATWGRPRTRSLRRATSGASWRSFGVLRRARARASAPLSKASGSGTSGNSASRPPPAPTPSNPKTSWAGLGSGCSATGRRPARSDRVRAEDERLLFLSYGPDAVVRRYGAEAPRRPAPSHRSAGAGGAQAPARPDPPLTLADVVTLGGYGLGVWWSVGGPAWAGVASIVADEVDGRLARATGTTTSHGSALDWGADVALTPLALLRLGREVGYPTAALLAAPPVLYAQPRLPDGVRPSIGERAGSRCRARRAVSNG